MLGVELSYFGKNTASYGVECIENCIGPIVPSPFKHKLRIQVLDPLECHILQQILAGLR